MGPAAANPFTPGEAIHFLASKVIEQAASEGAPLSRTEKGMLTYAAAGASEKNAELEDRFSAECDDDEYETKVAGLVKRAYESAKMTGAAPEWHDALRALKSQDYYLLVMVDQAGIKLPPPPGDNLRLFGTALLVIMLGVPAVVLFQRYVPPAWNSFESRFLSSDKAHWIAFVGVLVVLWLGSRVLQWVLRWVWRRKLDNLAQNTRNYG